ncbi:hypothetical protein [Halorubrum sp. FL23]|uniref:hypothetical protein n=1 Tax=Halorubrum sp. FL23 TaxID=3458704 RepID=UPI004033A047
MKALLLLVAGIGGLVQTLLPRTVVRAWAKAVYRNAGEAEPREWVYVATRAEGALIVLAALFGLYGVATAEDGEASAEDEAAVAADPETDA